MMSIYSKLRELMSYFLEDEQTRESRRLKESWDHQNRESLRDYLVMGFQNPQINVQSIMMRHQLLEWLFPGSFSDLKQEELAYTVKTHEMFEEALKEQETEHKVDATDAGRRQKIRLAEMSLKERLESYQNLWANTLSGMEAEEVTLLEPACGSANEYRFLDSYGLARFFNYEGFDISEKNIENARAMFPGVEFYVGDVMEIEKNDGAFDYLIVQDLFEHLSPGGMEKALGEICRVTKKSMTIVFFNMAERADHEIKKVRKYYWNQLSAPLIKSYFSERSRDVRVISVQEHLEGEFGFPGYYNPRAYTFIVDF